MDQPAQNVPEAPKKSFLSLFVGLTGSQFFKLLLVSSLIILLVLAFFGFFRLGKKFPNVSIPSNRSSKSSATDSASPVDMDFTKIYPQNPQNATKSAFFGDIIKIDIPSKTIQVKTVDSGTFNVLIGDKTQITSGNKKLTISDLKIGMGATVYSSVSKRSETENYKAEWISL